MIPLLKMVSNAAENVFGEDARVEVRDAWPQQQLVIFIRVEKDGKFKQLGIDRREIEAAIETILRKREGNSKWEDINDNF